VLWTARVAFFNGWPDLSDQISPVLCRKFRFISRLYRQSGFLTLFANQQRRAYFGMLCHFVLEGDWIGLLSVGKDDNVVNPPNMGVETVMLSYSAGKMRLNTRPAMWKGGSVTRQTPSQSFLSMLL
jgi:hypothetical protein